MVRSSLAFFLYLAPPFQDRNRLNPIEIKHLYAPENGDYSPRASAFWEVFPLFYVPWFVALGRRKPSSIGTLGPVWKQATWMLLAPTSLWVRLAFILLRWKQNAAFLRKASHLGILSSFL